MTYCPHQRVEFCPMYVAAHTGRGGSCCYGDLTEGCAVQREEMDYDAALAALRVLEPRIVGQCEFAESEHQRLEQRARNMRLNGVQ